jgi:hypothetical protein
MGKVLTRIWSEQVSTLYATNRWKSTTSAMMKDADTALSFVRRGHAAFRVKAAK